MKNNFKNMILALSFALLVIAMAGGNFVSAQAAAKDGTYYFSSCMTTKFKVKNNKLTLKVSIADTSGITKKNDENYKKYKLSLKVSKDCKYSSAWFNRLDGKTTKANSSYSEVKESIDYDRSNYKNTGNCNNVAYSSIVVKNNQVVKIEYLYS